jgi:hypothetical protein
VFGDFAIVSTILFELDAILSVDFKLCGAQDQLLFNLDMFRNLTVMRTVFLQLNSVLSVDLTFFRRVVLVFANRTFKNY